MASFKEALDHIEQAFSIICEINENPDIMDSQIESEPETENDSIGGDEDLLNDLNKIFTPVLVMQGFEGPSDKIQEAFSEASVLTEKNIIQFDNSTRMAQLISTCALLLQRKKNTEKYQMYKKAREICINTKLDMQKEEYDAAKTLAQKFLVKVSTTNNSSVARQAANELLPETQH